GATWNIPDNATVQSVVDDLSHAGQIHFTSTRTGKFVPATLKVAYFHERRSLNNFHRDRVITFEQIAE
ncbi:TPA: hypothetical protein ACPDNM_004988, partial [Escherichia coli]|nr:hypothetical protein [Escherichia coli]